MATRKPIVLNNGKIEQLQSADALDASQLDITGLTATDVSTSDSVPLYDASAAANRKLSVDRLLAYGHPGLCEGRLTLQSGVPIPTSDQTAKSTVYFTPYNGSRIAIYDGTRWRLYTFTELNVSLSGLTSGKNYDVFIYDNSGTLTLVLSSAWTNDTTRATGLTSVNGVAISSANDTYRYLGTIRTTGTNTTEDSAANRFVWNMYNRIRAPLKKLEATDSWTYNTASYRAMNNSTANAVAVVCGLDAYSMLELRCRMTAVCNVASNLYTAIGEDSSTACASSCIPAFMGTYAGGANIGDAFLTKLAGIGHHIYYALERAYGSGTTTWYGDGGDDTLLKNGLHGWWEY